MSVNGDDIEAMKARLAAIQASRRDRVAREREEAQREFNQQDEEILQMFHREAREAEYEKMSYSEAPAQPDRIRFLKSILLVGSIYLVFVVVLIIRYAYF